MRSAFTSWTEVLDYCRSHAWIYYTAPMDRGPVVLAIRRVFKNGKVRLQGRDVGFTMDSGHLSRLSRPR